MPNSHKMKVSPLFFIAVVMIGIVLSEGHPQAIDAHSGNAMPADVITSTVAPRNVMLFIGDGMGAEHLRAAGMYQNGREGTLVLESFPYSGTLTTYSADSSITDSAAAATAMATGYKVANGVLSIAWPGDEHELETLVEYFHKLCKRTALVSTTFMTHATPAAFGAHEAERTFYNNIARDYLTQTRPTVLFGGGGNGLNPTNAAAAGYTVVTDRATMQALVPPLAAPLSGQFGTSHLPYEYDYATGLDAGYNTLPHLSEMVSTTLRLLENTPNGFFMMVEGGRIDHAAHNNDLQRTIFEVLEFDRAVEIAYNWAMTRTDTLIIVTADHETGGLQVIANNGAGAFPTVTWASTGHTAIPIPVYAWGVNAALTAQMTDNTHIHALALAGPPAPAACTPTAVRGINLRNRTQQIGRLIVIGVTIGASLYTLHEKHGRPIAH